MARGIEGRAIFSTDRDRELFLSLLADGLKRTGYACYAWALMENHYHLVLRSSERHLSSLMRPLNGRYAQTFSRMHNRRGYLFQDRYKSLVTQDQRYVEQLIRYVHANPLRAGICRSMTELDRYAWTGHAVLMGIRSGAFQTTWPVLRRFGKTTNEARRRYREFIDTALNANAGEWDLFRKGTTGRDMGEPGAYVIGDTDFVKEVLAKDREKRLRVARYRRERLSMPDIAETFSRAAGIDTDELRRRARGNRTSALRKVFAYVCKEWFGFTIVEIARYLDCTHSPVSLAARQGEVLAKERAFDKILIALRP